MTWSWSRISVLITTVHRGKSTALLSASKAMGVVLALVKSAGKVVSH
jgi:hypothetical protein